MVCVHTESQDVTHTTPCIVELNMYEFQHGYYTIKHEVFYFTMFLQWYKLTYGGIFGLSLLNL